MNVDSDSVAIMSGQSPESRLKRGANSQKHIYLGSPLKVAYDFLTVPTNLASRAYAFFPIRKALFERFDAYPDAGQVLDNDNLEKLSVDDIAIALDKTLTSFRHRYNSLGNDAVPATGSGNAGGVLRQYLASRGILWLRFIELETCLDFLSKDDFHPSNQEYEFIRANELANLPELGEIVNQLWGVQVPIRGAGSLFRGGLRLASDGSLVLGIQGEAGSGKTSFALAIAASIAPYGIDTLFVTAEEGSKDILGKIRDLIPDGFQSLSFFRPTISWLEVEQLVELGAKGRHQKLDALDSILSQIIDQIKISNQGRYLAANEIPKPCEFIVVLDGLHDIFELASNDANGDVHDLLDSFIGRCRELNTIIILTAAKEWGSSGFFNYHVDVALNLVNEVEMDGKGKPFRMAVLSKSRHQLSAVGAHGLSISGDKGVRLTPQIHDELSRRTIWRSRTYSEALKKKVFQKVRYLKDGVRSLNTYRRGSRGRREILPYDKYVDIFDSSHVFINGEGPGNKAGLAMKIALGPLSTSRGGKSIARRRKVLILSFLYAEEHYRRIFNQLRYVFRRELRGEGDTDRAMSYEVVQLYPGHYRPEQLFNRIEWKIREAELSGDKFTGVIIDGIHNIHHQFPDIEAYPIFWPQMFALLRSRSHMIVTTNTTFPGQEGERSYGAFSDNATINTLLHSLVQKTDFRFHLSPIGVLGDFDAGNARVDYSRPGGDLFWLRCDAAIAQRLPDNDIMWDRQEMVFLVEGDYQYSLPLAGDGEMR